MRIHSVNVVFGEGRSLTLTKPAGITLAATFFIHHGGFAAFGAQVADVQAETSKT